MGLILGFETDTGQEIPFWFTRSDSKSLRRHLLWFESDENDELFRILKYLHLELKPLSVKKLVGREEETLENFISRDPNDKERVKYWYEEQARREAAWQSPDTIISAIKPLLFSLEANPSIFNDLGTSDSYFTSGCFRQDLIDIISMLSWAQANGISKVRLTEG